MTLIIPIFLSFASFAEKGNFEEHKKTATENMQKRIDQLTKAKSCMAGATDRQSLKACRKDLKEWRHQMKAKRQGMKMERMEKKLKKMKEKDY